MIKKSFYLYPVVLFFLLPVFTCSSQRSDSGTNSPVTGSPPQEVEDIYRPDPEGYSVTTWIEGLVVPWELVFLPDARALVTERPGRIRLIKEGELLDTPYLNLENEVAHIGEGGLMGLTVHPDFPSEPYLYVMYTYRSGTGLNNGVARIRDYGDYGEPEGFILDNIPGGRLHNGGRIHFGPDGYLYITAGETASPELAQNIDSLGGKILRITADGSIPADNPFPGSPVYSYGHRNPQGLTWHPATGTLFASDHGPSGEFGLSGHDTIHRIEKGGNYGWPHSLGVTGMEQYIPPLIMWVRATPPAGMTFHQEFLYIATLRSQALIRVDLEQDTTGWRVLELVRLFSDEKNNGRYGRLRGTVVGPDNALYVLTSNRDGRGSPAPEDDRILRIVP